jgi:hypothetical protein
VPYIFVGTGSGCGTVTRVCHDVNPRYNIQHMGAGGCLLVDSFFLKNEKDADVGRKLNGGE